MTPLYAAFLNRRFAGRENVPIHGVGVGVEYDLRLRRWLWLRALVLHSRHAVEANAQVEEDGTIIPLAAAGTIASTNFGGSIAYPLDLGRFLTLIGLGAGGFAVAMPEPNYVYGQHGSYCRSDGECDLGSRCRSDGRCHRTVSPELHLALGVERLIGRYFSAGINLRYYVLPSDLERIPIYLVAGLRLGIRI